MFSRVLIATLCLGAGSGWAFAQGTGASVERGRYLAQTTGCNDCHTEGYARPKATFPRANG